MLAEVAGHVYSVEVIPELATTARNRLDQLGYNNIELKVAQGREGWDDEAPFQAILVTAAASEVPPALIEQLDRGGRMIIPIGSQRGPQNLIRITKDQSDILTKEPVLPVAFVPLV